MMDEVSRVLRTLEETADFYEEMGVDCLDDDPKMSEEYTVTAINLRRAAFLLGGISVPQIGWLKFGDQWVGVGRDGQPWRAWRP